MLTMSIQSIVWWLQSRVCWEWTNTICPAVGLIYTPHCRPCLGARMHGRSLWSSPLRRCLQWSMLWLSPGGLAPKPKVKKAMEMTALLIEV